MVAPALAVIGDAISAVTQLREISKKIGDAEFSGLLADLQLELAEAKSKIADPVATNAELRERVCQLERTAAAVVEMEFDGAVYRKAGDASAYCPACWDANRLQVRLTALPANLARLAKYTCPHCNAPAGLRR